ncbi:MAG TPA: hypothetical protein VMX12_02040 [Acidimicrobiia bacterium]|nr:hypothetical protein [Acidimicrobiia bacterium]
MTIVAAKRWPSNAELIADAAQLHLDAEALALDATFGRGTWWKVWRPNRLITVDLSKGDPMVRADFRRLPFRPGTFGLVAYDPPYKLNGTGTPDADERYGVELPASRAGRQELILAGLEGCAAVLAKKGMLIVKVQDQVNGGKMRWQTTMVAIHAASLGLRLVDRFDKLGARDQPEGTSQQHARDRGSTLLVFRHLPRHPAAVADEMFPDPNRWATIRDGFA